MQIQARPYQSDAEQSIFDYFAKGYVGNPLVAMPTGTGKSVVIAMFITHVMQMWPTQRIMVLTHVKELIEQNCLKLKQMWPGAPVGIYSAGLNQRDTRTPIVFGGVASVVKNLAAFGHRDLLLIDEAHLLGPKADSMYGKVIEGLKAINPKLKVIGFTATPYRTGQGLLTEGEAPLFTDICYNITGMREFIKLIDDGYLAPLISKRTVAQVNLSGVSISNGDYNLAELEARMDTQNLNYQICKEIVEYGQHRKAWLIFAAGVKHAEHLAELLRSFGVPTIAIHSKMGGDRDKAIRDFKAGRLRAVVNNNVLTTGFDYPAIDFIGMCRPTMSTGLWVQMLGRGTRPSAESGKADCLVLDFAGNTVRLGPINDPVIPKKRGSREAAGVPPIKICPFCSVYNYTTAQFCCNCGEPFQARESKLDNTASAAELIRRDSEQNPIPKYEWLKVSRVLYRKLTPKGGKPPLMKVSYICEGVPLPISEVVCLENTTGAKNLAAKWWRSRMGSAQAPPSVDEALKWTSLLAVPEQIQVWMNKKYPEVVNVKGLRR